MTFTKLTFICLIEKNFKDLDQNILHLELLDAGVTTMAGGGGDMTMPLMTHTRHSPDMAITVHLHP